MDNFIPFSLNFGQKFPPDFWVKISACGPKFLHFGGEQPFSALFTKVSRKFKIFRALCIHWSFRQFKICLSYDSLKMLVKCTKLICITWSFWEMISNTWKTLLHRISRLKGATVSFFSKIFWPKIRKILIFWPKFKSLKMVLIWFSLSKTMLSKWVEFKNFSKHLKSFPNRLQTIYSLHLEL